MTKQWLCIAGAALALCLFGYISTSNVSVPSGPAEADADIDALMQSATTANEAESEGISYELYQQFTENPAAFLDAFSAQSESVRQTVAQFIAWENAYDTKNLPQYLSDTDKLSESQKQASDILLQFWTENQSKSSDDAAGADRIYLQQNA